MIDGSIPAGCNADAEGGRADMPRRRGDARRMDSSSTDVMLFAFHDAHRAGDVAAAACDHRGVRCVAVVAQTPECEIRIISPAGNRIQDARWLARTLAALDALSAPLRVLAGAGDEFGVVALPDSKEGFDTFGRLVGAGTLVVLVAVCDGSAAGTASFENRLGSALFGIPTSREGASR